MEKGAGMFSFVLPFGTYGKAGTMRCSLSGMTYFIVAQSRKLAYETGIAFGLLGAGVG